MPRYTGGLSSSTLPMYLTILGLGLILGIGVAFLRSCNNSTAEGDGSPTPSIIIITVTPSPAAGGVTGGGPSIPPIILPPPTPVPFRVDRINPLVLTPDEREWRVTITGHNLTAVNEVVLQRADNRYDPLLPQRIRHTDQELTLDLSELRPRLTGAETCTIILNEQRVGRIDVRNFIRSVRVAGVRQAYKDRDPRLFFEGRSGFGAFLWSEASMQTKVSAHPQPGHVVISQNDTLEILAEADPLAETPVYHVQVRTNRIDGPEMAGKQGWIARWLVDDQDVPPPPTPTPTATRTPQPTRVLLDFWIDPQVEDDRRNCAPGQAASYIGGTVYYPDGTVRYDAIVEVRPRDGHRAPIRQPRGSKNYGAPSLSCGWWIVELVAVGDTPLTGIQYEVFVTGDADSGATIDFRQR